MAALSASRRETQIQLPSLGNRAKLAQELAAFHILSIAQLCAKRCRERSVHPPQDAKQVLDIPDPYLLFYLRWSGRLLEPPGASDRLSLLDNHSHAMLA